MRWVRQLNHFGSEGPADSGGGAGGSLGLQRTRITLQCRHARRRGVDPSFFRPPRALGVRIDWDEQPHLVALD